MKKQRVIVGVLSVLAAAMLLAGCGAGGAGAAAQAESVPPVSLAPSSVAAVSQSVSVSEPEPEPAYDMDLVRQAAEGVNALKDVMESVDDDVDPIMVQMKVIDILSWGGYYEKYSPAPLPLEGLEHPVVGNAFNFNAGMFYYSLPSYGTALEYFEAALENDPEDTQAARYRDDCIAKIESKTTSTYTEELGDAQVAVDIMTGERMTEIERKETTYSSEPLEIAYRGLELDKLA